MNVTAHIDHSKLDVTGLCVQRGDKALFDNLSFSARDGDLIWITGTNGSGKTSLLKCLAGLLRQDAGDIEFMSSIAYLGHADSHKANLTVVENLEFWNTIYGEKLNIEQVLKTVGAWHLRDLRAKSLSAGQSRRVALARTLLKGAKLWLLDEPSAPMDEAGRQLINDLISNHLSNGGIVLLASHSTPYKIGERDKIMVLNEHYDE